MRRFKFEKLIVWQKALDFSNQIHHLARRFPREEKYILSAQIKRAADSVVLNIAEGSTGQSRPEFNRFLGIALRSNIEVVACLHLGLKRQIISDSDFANNYEKALEISRMINALRKSLK